MTLADAQKILDKIAAGIAGDVAPEVVKEAMKLLMEAVMQSQQEEKAFRKAMPLPERACPWRLSDEVQTARLKVPEPAHCDCETVRYILPQPPQFSIYYTGEPVSMEPIKTSEFRKKRFRYGGACFWAWTSDGKTPVFPIPL